MAAKKYKAKTDPSYGKYCSYVYVLKYTYSRRACRRAGVSLSLQQFKKYVKEENLVEAISNIHHWLHDTGSLMEMSVVKTVQFSDCNGRAL